jgi:hypothetical protein
MSNVPLIRAATLAGLLTALCVAQLNRGSLTGVATDPSGAAVSSTVINATHLDTGVVSSTSTTENGNYTLPALPIGIYRVEFEAAGFKKVVRDKMEVIAGGTHRLDVQFELGSVTESVMVQAQASALQTESSRVATNVNTKLVEDLPLQVNGAIRSVFNLALIAPETKTAGGFRIGGGQAAGWEMAMDGLPLTSASAQYQQERAPISSVPIDAISEFTVESSGMKAEFGRAMGAVTFETKSGTNQIHGNAFEFLRNNALDARGFFNTNAPIIKQSDFGGTLGAPVVIPKIYNGRNRTFFFASYQGFRNRAGTGANYMTIPTPANYEGDFSGWTRNGVAVPIYDPASTRANPSGSGYVRDLFPGSLIPKSRFSQVASRYIALRPAELVPNVTGRSIDPIQNYLREGGSNVNPWNKGSVRIDHQISSQDRFSFLFLKGIWEDKFGPDGPPGMPVPFNGSAVWARRNTSGRWSWDRTISARVINSLRVSYQKEKGTLTTLSQLDPNAKWGEKLGITNLPGPDRGLTPVSFTGYTGWQGSGWGVDAGGNFNVTNDLTLIRGSHVIKTGFFHAHDRWDGGGQHRPNGSFGFSQLSTAVPGDQSQNTGNGFASFLLGYASSWGLETPRLVRQIYKYWGGFVQDDWKVTSKLTLNLGLRYEYTPPIRGGAYVGLVNWEDLSTGTLDGFSNFDPTVPNPAAGGRPGAVIFSGDGPGRFTGSMFDGYPWGISPRIGLAYRATSKTVVRAYGGRSLGAVKTTGGSTHFDGFILNFTINSQDNSINDILQWDRGFPAYQKPPFIDPTLANDRDVHFWQRSDAGRPSDFYTWNLDLQQELSASMVVTAAYTGTKGTYLSSNLNRINQIDPRYIQQYGVNLLRSGINSTAARNAGIPVPYAGFGSLSAHTVQRALSPFPQYANILTNGGQPSSVGERAGNSTYHAMTLKLDKRYSNGLSLLGSYVLSKMLSDADTAQIGGNGSIDHYNKKLEKALASVDQTHVGRIAFTYDLPVGRAKRLSLGRVGNYVLGDWSLAGFLSYESGTPDSVGAGYSPIGTGSRVFVTSYENWRGPIAGEKFDPFVDKWYNRSAFNQGISTDRLNSEFGNATRVNPKLRIPWNLNENLSVAKNIPFGERVRLSLRGEAFNLFNRVRWGGPSGTVTAANFGDVRGQRNDPRRMQVAFKITF